MFLISPNCIPIFFWQSWGQSRSFKTPMGAHPRATFPMPASPLAASYFWITLSLSLLIAKIVSLQGCGNCKLMPPVEKRGGFLTHPWLQCPSSHQWAGSSDPAPVTMALLFLGGELFLTPLRLSRSRLWGVREFLGLRVAQCCPCTKEPPQTRSKAHQRSWCGAAGRCCCPARCLLWHLWPRCHLPLSLACWLPALQLPDKGTQGSGIAIYLQDSAVR